MYVSYHLTHLQEFMIYHGVIENLHSQDQKCWNVNFFHIQ
jgi:hypothetical protein